MILFALSISVAQPPTYVLSARNFSLDDTLGGGDNMLKFDIFLQWTNQGSSDPFNYASCQYCLTVNPPVTGGVNIPIKITNSDLPQSLQPGGSTNGAASQIRLTGNLPGAIYEVSSVFPGTKVAELRLTSNLPTFPVTPLGIAWRLTGSGLITKISYLDPNGVGIFITDATGASNYIQDTSAISPLPVELSSFTSTVNRNNVTLNWSTAKETNNQGFDIEKSFVNSNTWAKVGNVNGNGNTNEIKNYSYSERAATGKYSYRLKQIDFNGNIEYFNLSNEVEVGIPGAYAISQNYPNPFNPTTKIDYDIPFDGKVNILLYDISGRQVGNLVNDVKTAGYYTVQFNASNLASGMYFYRITAEGNGNNFVSTKKMVLIK